MTRVVCIGECMVELRPEGEGLYRQGFAGDTYNTAVYLKRAAPEIDVQFATATGDDPLSRAMRASWRMEGVGDRLAFTVPAKRPGLYAIELDAKGERHFHYWRGESAARDWLTALLAHGGETLLEDADLLHLSGISLAILSPEDRCQAISLLGRRKARLSFDPNVRLRLWSSTAEARDNFEELAGLCDILLPSVEDLDLLYDGKPGEAAGLLRRLGVREAALTTEPGKCLVLTENATEEVSGPLAARVVDTSGAGDSFDGAYLAARLHGGSPAEAARAGLSLASKVVGWPGAVIPNI